MDSVEENKDHFSKYTTTLPGITHKITTTSSSGGSSLFVCVCILLFSDK